MSVGGEHDVGSPRVSVWDFPLSDGNKIFIPFSDESQQVTQRCFKSSERSFVCLGGWKTNNVLWIQILSVSLPGVSIFYGDEKALQSGDTFLPL